MKEEPGKISITSKGLGYKLKIAFVLMSIIPLLILLYLVMNYIVPQAGYRLDVFIFVIITLGIIIIGYLVIKEIVDRVVAVSNEAKMIASTEINGKTPSGTVDEVGLLGQTLNQLTGNIRSNMEELKSYSQKTTEINLQIQKHVLMLSHLLEISSLISQGTDLESAFTVAIEKARLIADSDASYLFMKHEAEEAFYMKCANALSTQYLMKLKVMPNDPFFYQLINQGKAVIMDRNTAWPESVQKNFFEVFGFRNTLAQPIIVKGKIEGIIGVGNTKESFVFAKEDEHILDVFSKQISIAIENDRLTRRVEKLEVKDALTGLYNKSYILNRLQEEIKRAIIRQRPCSFILLNVDNFGEFKNNFSAAEAATRVKTIATFIRDAVTEIDRVARFADNEFAVVLPEKNKREAHEIAERIRKHTEISFNQEHDSRRRLTISAGISENPIDGVTGEELLKKAHVLLQNAKQQGKNRIIL